jgi:hypothetical protein
MDGCVSLIEVPLVEPALASWRVQGGRVIRLQGIDQALDVPAAPCSGFGRELDPGGIPAVLHSCPPSRFGDGDSCQNIRESKKFGLTERVQIRVWRCDVVHPRTMESRRVARAAANLIASASESRPGKVNDGPSVRKDKPACTSRRDKRVGRAGRDNDVGKGRRRFPRKPGEIIGPLGYQPHSGRHQRGHVFAGAEEKRMR